MPSQPQTVFVGIRGNVLAIDRKTGAERWNTSLKGADFVNVVVQDGDLFAASRGRLYRLDPENGDILWCNELPGMGWGIVSIAGTPGVAGAAEKKKRDQEAAAAAAGAS